MLKGFFIQNEELEREKKRLIKENQDLKKINWNNNIKITKAKVMATKTINKLEGLQSIDRKGIREESKRKERNILISDLKRDILDIIKQLVNN